MNQRLIGVFDKRVIFRVISQKLHNVTFPGFKALLMCLTSILSRQMMKQSKGNQTRSLGNSRLDAVVGRK